MLDFSLSLLQMLVDFVCLAVDLLLLVPDIDKLK